MIVSKMSSIFKFAVKNHWITIILTFCIALIVGCIVQPFWIFSGTQNVDWWGWVEPVSGVTILFVAVVLWFIGVRRDWEASLPKRLSADFVYKGKTILRFEDVYLAGSGDIRQWTQQIGRQMCGNEPLKFSPMIQSEKPIIKVQSSCQSDEFVKCYRIEVTLLSLPNRYLRLFVENNCQKNGNFKGTQLLRKLTKLKQDKELDGSEQKRRETALYDEIEMLIEDYLDVNNRMGSIHWFRDAEKNILKKRDWDLL